MRKDRPASSWIDYLGCKFQLYHISFSQWWAHNLHKFSIYFLKFINFQSFTAIVFKLHHIFIHHKYGLQFNHSVPSMVIQNSKLPISKMSVWQLNEINYPVNIFFFFNSWCELKSNLPCSIISSHFISPTNMVIQWEWFLGHMQSMISPSSWTVDRQRCITCLAGWTPHENVGKSPLKQQLASLSYNFCS